jgi:hypothetical protein
MEALGLQRKVNAHALRVTRDQAARLIETIVVAFIARMEARLLTITEFALVCVQVGMVEKTAR